MHTILITVKKLNLSQLTGLCAAALVLCIGFLISFLTWANLSTKLEQDAKQEAASQLKLLTITLAPSLLQQDRISLNLSLQEWSKHSPLLSIRVFNSSQVLIAEIGNNQLDALEVSQAVTQDNLSVGLVRAQFTVDAARTLAARYLALGIMASGLSSLLAGLLFFALSERYLGYLRKLQQNLNAWQQGSALTLPQKPRLADLQALHSTLERVALHEQQQQAMNEALGHFVAPKSSHTKLSLQYHHCAMLFIEIQNLKELQDDLSAQELTLKINHYYRLLRSASKLYNGRLDRYAGNGAVVLFGLESNDKAQETLHALYTAQLFLGLIRDENESEGSAKIAFRLSVHSGDVLLAPVVGPEHHHYDLIGDTLHWAAHLASTSEDQRILASQSIKDALRDHGIITWQCGPEITDLYGERQATWWLESLTDKQQSLIDRQIRQLKQIAETMSEKN